MDQSLPILDSGSTSPADLDPARAREKLATLEESLEPLVVQGVLVAFSGGMDSAFLLWACHRVARKRGGRVVALTTTSPSTPSHDKEDARSFAASLGVEHIWEESKELELPDYARNDRQRCYHCKRELFRIAREVAGEEETPCLLYGYNASDHRDDRPGHRAAMEAGVRTPLSEAGLTKAEIRYLMEEAGLPLHGKPASPCLSSRIMTGIPITSRRLRDVEAMESILRDAGLSTLRVRVCREEGGDAFLRVEVPPDDLPRVLEVRAQLRAEGARRGYRWVTLDLGGYRTGGGVTNPGRRDGTVTARRMDERGPERTKRKP